MKNQKTVDGERFELDEVQFDAFGAPYENGRPQEPMQTYKPNLRKEAAEKIEIKKLRSLTQMDFENMYHRIKNERYDDFGASVDSYDH